ncbi:ankyrin repeat-containing domain protein [Echria macrotheca]|uniref:Ankyrin repeat-containing domain protein n=1 Tax=Echria macrotheca TaxID=438768 RepID=A0AAJ0F786_9PEZI|nr:ankyrin repeat-containing domain protein [Echria macrotheca]
MSSSGHVYENITINATNVQLGDRYTSRGGAELLDEFRDQLFVTNASADLAKTARRSGKRADETCEWILTQEEYIRWDSAEGLQVLWLVGTAGIGKTVLSCFLVSHLQKDSARLPSKITIYHLCDYKDDGSPRNTAVGILRCVLYQLLEKQPDAFSWISSNHRHHHERQSLISDLDGVWNMLVGSLGKCGDDVRIRVVIDALDECDGASRVDLVGLLTSLPPSTNLKFIITTRPDDNIEAAAVQTAGHRVLRVDSAKIKTDLGVFIKQSVSELRLKRPSFPDGLLQSIKSKVESQADGTFLWVALIFKDFLTAATAKAALKKLDSLPSDLPGIYKRILDGIDDDVAEDAAFLLRWMVVARRSMSVTELATAQVLAHEGWSKQGIPPAAYIEQFKDGYKARSHLIRYDPEGDSVTLVHGSARDYLIGASCPTRYRVDTEAASIQVLDTCWRYWCFPEIQNGPVIVTRSATNILEPVIGKNWDRGSGRYRFLDYAMGELQDLKGYDRLRLVTAFVLFCPNLHTLPELRDLWLIGFASAGHTEGVSALISKGADVGVRSRVVDYHGHDKLLMPRHESFFAFASHSSHLNEDRTVLQWAAVGGHVETCKALIEGWADISAKGKFDRKTALHTAAESGHADQVMVSLLLDSGANMDDRDVTGATALLLALCAGRDGIAAFLLDRGADVSLSAPPPRIGGQPIEEVFPLGLAARTWETMLFPAARTGCHLSATRLLQPEKGVEVNAEDSDGYTALAVATEFGHYRVARVLAEGGGDLQWVDKKTKETLLHLAVGCGNASLVAWLAEIIPHMMNSVVDCSKHRIFNWKHPSRNLSEFPNTLDTSTNLLMEYSSISANTIAEPITPLHLATLLGDTKVFSTLFNSGAIFDERDNSSSRAINTAARRGNTDLVRFIVENGVSNPINELDHKGRAALHYATTGGLHATAESLVCNGSAEINTRTSEEETALHLAAWLSSPDDGTVSGAWLTNWLHESNAIKDAATTVRWLLEAGAEIDATTASGGYTALHIAVMQGNCPVVKTLLAHGANTHIRDREGRTALDLLTAAYQTEPWQLGWWNRRAYEMVGRLLKSEGGDTECKAQLAESLLSAGVSSQSNDSAVVVMSREGS